APLSMDAPGRAADRASQRAGQAHQRPSLRVRRFSPADVAGDLGELPTFVARPARGAVRGRPGCRPGQDADAAPMGPSVSTAPADRPGSNRSVLQRLIGVCAMVRYRFFLYAG